jgi:hypothetical protein
MHEISTASDKSRILTTGARGPACVGVGARCEIPAGWAFCLQNIDLMGMTMRFGLTMRFGPKDTMCYS